MSRRGWFLTSAGFLSVSFACSSNGDRPASSRIGLAQDSGAQSSTDAASSHEEGGVDSGPADASEVSPVSPAGCDVYDAKRVYLKGSFGGFGAVPATVAFTSPPRFCISPAGSDFVLRPSDGRLLEIPDISANPKIHIFNRDPLVFDPVEKQWMVKDIVMNDTVVPTPGDAYRPFVWPDTSDIAYGGPTRGVYSKTGVYTDTSSRPYLGYGGHILDNQLSPPSWEITDSTVDGGARITIQNPHLYIFAARAKPDGFSAAASIGETSPNTGVELWHITFDGTTTKTGAYAALPAGFTMGKGAGGAALDADDNLYQLLNPDAMDSPNNNNAVVVKRPLAPGSSTIAYDSGAASSDLTVTPPRVWVKINISHLFTGP